MRQRGRRQPWQTGGRPHRRAPIGPALARVVAQTAHHANGGRAAAHGPRGPLPRGHEPPAALHPRPDGLARHAWVRAPGEDEVGVAGKVEAGEAAGVGKLDPLLRFDDPRSLLREGRALSAALLNMQRQLTRPTPTVDAMKARLARPLGPTALATKIVESVTAQADSKAGGLFKLGELALAVGRADWATCLSRLSPHDAALARLAIDQSLDEIGDQLALLVTGPEDITEYARRAVKEARACLGN